MTTPLSEPSEPPNTTALPTVIRLVAAVALLIGGLVHLELYFSGYRNIAGIGPSFALQGMASIVVAGALVVRRDAVVRLAAAAIAASTLLALALSRTGRGVFGFRERGLEPAPQTTIALVAEIVVIVAVGITLLPITGRGQSLRPRIAAAALVAVAIVSIGATATWAASNGSNTNTTETATPTTEPAATPPQPSDGPARSMPDTAADDPATSSATPPPTTAGEQGPTATERDDAEPTPGARDDAATLVSIVDFAFVDQDLEIPVGTTVRWVNDDSFAHSVVADDGSFVSERLEPGDAFEFTFATAGRFDYICGLHPSMTATIVVVG